MVFESLINPIKAEKKPWEMFFIGIIYTSAAVILSLYIFRDYASLVMIFLTVLPSVPLMYSAIKMEEKKDLVFEQERILIKEHGKVAAFFAFLFLGMVVSFALWYVFLPAETVSLLFNTQINEITQIEEISSGATGHAVNLYSNFTDIFLNNILVLILVLIFAFLYGIGGMFILTWNAAIMGAAVGIFIKNSIDSYLISIPFALLRYSIHGIPEMVAYFTAGLAGSIISIAIIRHDFGTEKFKRVLIDSIDLILLSFIILFISALLEIFVTPLLF